MWRFLQACSFTNWSGKSVELKGAVARNAVHFGPIEEFVKNMTNSIDKDSQR